MSAPHQGHTRLGARRSAVDSSPQILFQISIARTDSLSTLYDRYHWLPYLIFGVGRGERWTRISVTTFARPRETPGG